MNLPAFIDRWLKSGRSERANKDSFLKELCQVLDLPEPDPKRGDPENDRYVFERDVRVQAPDGKVTTKFMDLYKEGCFVLEAKQSAEKTTPRPGAKVSTEGWENAMQRACTQAMRYAENIDAAVSDAYGWPRDLTDEQILEKLVALNAERAEEERNGHIRWLRPDFQNPTGARKPENLTLAGTETPDEPEDDKPSPVATVAPWPKRPGERIAAIRDLVVASKRVWQTAEVAAAFKGSKKKDVADLLDSLAGIGVLVEYGETGKDSRWGLPTRATA